MNTPQVSVIMPVYNGEKTIQEAIESVLNQTFADFELIVIDDGSQDSTLDILGTIQDPRVKVFSYDNAGVSASRNRGLELTCGKFVAFLDADDLWTADKLEAQLQALEANPQAALAYSWTEFIDEAGQCVGTRLESIYVGNVFAQLLESNFIGSGSNPLISTQVFDEVGGFDESLTHGEDWELYLRIAARYHFAVVPSVQVLYRVTDYSATSNAIKLEEGSLEVIEQAFAQVPESLQYLRKRTLGNIYDYLTARAIYGVPGRAKGLLAVKYLSLAIWYNPSLLKRGRVVLSRLMKIVMAILLSPQQAQALRNRVKTLEKKKDDANSLSQSAKSGELVSRATNPI